MKHLFLCLIALALLAGCARVEFEDLAGNTIGFDDLRGKWVVVNYWAVWCNPCREEIPELNGLAREEIDRLVVIGVNYDLPPRPELEEQVQLLGIDFPVLLQDPSGVLGYRRPEVLPTTYLIDPDGEVVASLQGPQSIESIVAAIEATGS